MTSSTSSGGYEATWFVDSVDPSQKCPHCGRILKDPYTSNKCGHHLCYECVQEVLVKKLRCPSIGCGGPIELTSVTYNRALNDTIVATRVKCGSLGCAWVGKLSDREYHMTKQCDRALVSCPWGCKKQVQRRFIDQHQLECDKRCLPCPHCSKVIALDLAESHFEVCPKYPVQCPNAGCDETTLRRLDLQHHLAAVCRRQPVACEVVNCCERVPRDEMDAHMVSAAPKHVALLNAALVAERQLVHDLVRRVQALEEAHTPTT
eukprot:PhM_4_TR4297/c0_g1_i2/m.41115/K09848/TRAF4; TNF receptor-associated factor 4